MERRAARAAHAPTEHGHEDGAEGLVDVAAVVERDEGDQAWAAPRGDESLDHIQRHRLGRRPVGLLLNFVLRTDGFRMEISVIRGENGWQGWGCAPLP